MKKIIFAVKPLFEYFFCAREKHGRKLARKHATWLLLLCLVFSSLNLSACSDENNKGLGLSAEENKIQPDDIPKRKEAAITGSYESETLDPRVEALSSMEEGEPATASYDIPDKAKKTNLSPIPPIGNADFNSDLNEPPVPLAPFVPDESNKGIAGHRTADFFATLGSGKLYYRYVTISPGEKASELTIAIDGYKSYLRIFANNSETLLVNPDGSGFYRIDKDKSKIIPLALSEKISSSLNSYAFGNLGSSASLLYFTGEGSCKDFYGSPADFEEFGRDGNSYVRYYFSFGEIIGHRIFENGKMLSEVHIKELNNEPSEELFLLPENYEIMPSPINTGQNTKQQEKDANESDGYGQ